MSDENGAIYYKKKHKRMLRATLDQRRLRKRKRIAKKRQKWYKKHDIGSCEVALYRLRKPKPLSDEDR